MICATCAQAGWGIAWHAVHIFYVPAQVATLSERFLAHVANEGTLGCVLSKMVPQVAALGEDCTAALKLALEEALGTVSLLIEDLDSFTPLRRQPSECFLSLILLHIIIAGCAGDLPLGLSLDWSGAYLDFCHVELFLG